MLADRPEELETLFKDVIRNKLTVRETEKAARYAAEDKVRHKALIDPEVKQAENKLSEKLGAKVMIEGSGRDEGGKIVIRYFNKEDLRNILESMESDDKYSVSSTITGDRPISSEQGVGGSEPVDSELYSVSNFSV